MSKLCLKCNQDFSKEVEAKIKSKSWTAEFASKINVCDSCIDKRKTIAKVHKGNSTPHNPQKYADRLAGNK